MRLSIITRLVILVFEAFSSQTQCCLSDKQEKKLSICNFIGNFYVRSFHIFFFFSVFLDKHQRLFNFCVYRIVWFVSVRSWITGNQRNRKARIIRFRTINIYSSFIFVLVCGTGEALLFCNVKRNRNFYSIYSIVALALHFFCVPAY